MRYLYGDSTPFPLTENFLDTLCAATDACVAILQADELADQGNRRVRELESNVTQELAQLAALARRVEDVFGAESAIAVGATPTDAAKGKIGEQAWAIIKQARAEILQSRDTAVAAETRAAPHAQVLPALGAFLVTHQLPETSWSIRWHAGLGASASKAEVFAKTPCGLESSFDIEVPEGHIWFRAVKAAHLDKNATIQMMRKPWLGGPRPCPERLHKLFITSVIHTPERASMILSRSPKEPSEGIEIVLRAESSADVTATRVSKDGTPVALPEKLSPADAAVVAGLWARVETTIGELVCFRRRIRAASLGGVTVGEIVHPEAVAEVIIEAIAPIVREIVARTATPRELSLKRFLGDGRREEIFVGYGVVLDRLTGLTERHQAMFDALGLRPKPASKPAVVRKLPAPSRQPPKLRVVNGG